MDLPANIEADLNEWFAFADRPTHYGRVVAAMFERDQGSAFRPSPRPIAKPNPEPAQAREKTPREILRDNEWLNLEQAAIVWGCGKDKIVEQIGDKNLGRVGRLGDKLPLRDLNGDAGNKQYRFHRSLFETIEEDQDEPRKVALAKNLPVEITKRRRAGVA